MAFNCIKNDKQIYSFVYSLKDWIALKEDKTSSFNMACCGNQAILKTSKLGTQFFAHKSKPETNEITVPRNGRILMEFGTLSFYNRMVDYDSGRWVLIDTLWEFPKG